MSAIYSSMDAVNTTIYTVYNHRLYTTLYILVVSMSNLKVSCCCIIVPTLAN